VKRHCSEHQSAGRGLRVALLFACLGLALQAAPVEFKRGGDHKAEVIISGQPFAAYDFGDVVAKPSLMPLRTASGIVMSRRSPVVNRVTPHRLRVRRAPVLRLGHCSHEIGRAKRAIAAADIRRDLLAERRIIVAANDVGVLVGNQPCRTQMIRAM
jgi:hypothetical protein